MASDPRQLVTVLFPVARASGTLEIALRSIAAQTHRDLDILLVLNNTDDATRGVVGAAAKADPRVRIIEVDARNLAQALNAGLREARSEFVARMDADDWSDPSRIEVQLAAIRARPSIAALGSAFEIVGPGGRLIATTRPPTDPKRLRWRLALGNELAHGSMMLRRDAVLGVGGYDESLERAQDLDLWLRLSRDLRVASVPEVLYRYSASGGMAFSSSPLQARQAGEILAGAWATLAPRVRTSEFEALAQGVGGALGASGPEADGRGSLEEIERALDEHGPSAAGLLAWLWMQWKFPAAPSRAIDACRRARLREVGREIHSAGAERVWLWGAGVQGEWVLANRESLGLEIAGVVDDHAVGSRGEFRVQRPDALKSGDHVLLCSDWHEDALWEASTNARARGVNVWRLYHDQSATPALRT